MIRLASYLPIVGAVLSLAACGGGSDSGAGTANSPFVGTYRGSSTVTVDTPVRSQTVDKAISVYVNPDGLVQVGDGEATIYASGPLHGDSVRLEEDASEIVEAECSGTISLAGKFAQTDGGGAVFTGNWSSGGASCFGVGGTVSGPASATRVSLRARATRVFQTNNATLLQAFRRAAR